MGSRRSELLALFCGLFCGTGGLFLLAPTPPASSDGGGLKANLDLPFDAGGTAEEEEEAPEIVVFFGQVYEASAVVFSLDESGSMTENNRWQLQMKELTKAISELSSEAEFGIVFYSSGVTAFRNAPVKATPSNKDAALAFALSRSPQGDTCLGEGAVKALQIATRSEARQRAVIVTSDGKPDVCSTGRAATPEEAKGIIRQTLTANPGRAVRLHTIWVGTANDAQAIAFMRDLADAHGGSARVVSR